VEGGPLTIWYWADANVYFTSPDNKLVSWSEPKR
jgi:hypothetical protein